MQKINPNSNAKFILMMVAKSPSLILLMGIISLRLQNWVTTLRNLYSYLIRPVLHYFLPICKSSSTVPAANYCSAERGLIRGEVEMVMEKLGFNCNPCGGGGDELEERIGYEEIEKLFDENEPSLEEVKEAFDVFDKNRDGYIDAEELQEVICRLGFKEFEEGDCDRMIAAFDDNGDGFVDFNDFLKLLHNSF